MPGFITVKTGFDGFFKPSAVLRDVLQDVVAAVTPILIHAQLFASFHVIRLLQAQQEVTAVDQTFFNRCIAAVTTPTEDSQKFDSQGLANPAHPKHWTPAGQQFKALTTSLVDYTALTEGLGGDYAAQLPFQYKKPERPSVLKDVSAHFFGSERRWLCIK